MTQEEYRDATIIRGIIAFSDSSGVHTAISNRFQYLNITAAKSMIHQSFGLVILRMVWGVLFKGNFFGLIKSDDQVLM